MEHKTSKQAGRQENKQTHIWKWNASPRIICVASLSNPLLLLLPPFVSTAPFIATLPNLWIAARQCLNCRTTMPRHHFTSAELLGSKQPSTVFAKLCTYLNLPLSLCSLEPLHFYAHARLWCLFVQVHTTFLHLPFYIDVALSVTLVVVVVVEQICEVHLATNWWHQLTPIFVQFRVAFPWHFFCSLHNPVFPCHSPLILLLLLLLRLSTPLPSELCLPSNFLNCTAVFPCHSLFLLLLLFASQLLCSVNYACLPCNFLNFTVSLPKTNFPWLLPWPLPPFPQKCGHTCNNIVKYEELFLHCCSTSNSRWCWTDTT